MIEQQGRVVSLTHGAAMVRIGPTTGCSACDAGKGCGAGIFGRLLRRKAATVSLPNEINAREGQAVTVGIPETVFLRLLAHFYLLPLIAGLAGAVLGHHLVLRIPVMAGWTDAGSIAGAVLFAGLALTLNRNRQAKLDDPSGMRLVKFVTTEDNEVYTCARES